LRPITAWRRFELGLLFFMAYLFIASQVSFYRPGFGVFVLFLFSGLLAVVFARISYVGIHKGIIKNPFDLRWLSSVTGILGATVTLAALVGSVLTGQYRLFLDFLAAAVTFLIQITVFILGIPGLLISLLITPLIPWLKRHFPVTSTQANQDLSNIIDFFKNIGDRQPAPISVSLQNLFFWVLIVLLVVILIIRIRRKLAQGRYARLFEPEHLLKQGQARELIRVALRDAWDRWAARIRPVSRHLAAARIRRIYAQLMDLCAELKYPRPDSTTPLEFLPELGELFTDQTAALCLLTEAYVRVRYGELPESHAEIQAVEAAWQLILEEGARLKRAGLTKLKTAEVKEIERGGV
jgi:hypothetical protein